MPIMTDGEGQGERGEKVEPEVQKRPSSMTGIANWVNWVPPLSSSSSANFGLQKKGGEEGFVSWEHLCRRRGQTANKSIPKHLNLSISSSCKSPATGVLIFGGAFPIPYSVPYSANLQLNNYSFKQFGVSCELGYVIVVLALDSSSDETGERHCGRLINVCFYLKTIVALIW